MEEMDIGDILGIISIIVSSLALLVFYARWSLSLTLEFTDKPDIQDKKSKIENQLIEQIKNELEKLCRNYPDMSFEELYLTLDSFRDKASACKLSTRILRKISYNYATMTKKLVYLILGTFLIIVSIFFYFYPMEIPDNLAYVRDFFPLIIVLSFVVGLVQIFNNSDLIKVIRGTMNLRNSFYGLSDNPILEFAVNLEKRLKEEKFL